jgi:hypothetical protein
MKANRYLNLKKDIYFLPQTANNPAYQGFVLLVIASSTLTAFTLTGCALLTSHYVLRHYTGPNEADRRRLNRQLNLNLLIQVSAIFHFFFNFAPNQILNKKNQLLHYFSNFYERGP